MQPWWLYSQQDMPGNWISNTLDKCYSEEYKCDMTIRIVENFEHRIGILADIMGKNRPEVCKGSKLKMDLLFFSTSNNVEYKLCPEG